MITGEGGGAGGLVSVTKFHGSIKFRYIPTDHGFSSFANILLEEKHFLIKQDGNIIFFWGHFSDAIV